MVKIWKKAACLIFSVGMLGGWAEAVEPDAVVPLWPGDGLPPGVKVPDPQNQQPDAQGLIRRMDKPELRHWSHRRAIVGWEIFSELDLVTGAAEARAVLFAERAAAVIRAADSWKRPVAASQAGINEWPKLHCRSVEATGAVSHGAVLTVANEYGGTHCGCQRSPRVPALANPAPSHRFGWLQREAA